MPHLPTTLLKFTASAGSVSVLAGGIIYVLKKVVDVAADVWKARLLKERAKRFTEIYGPDGRVARMVEIDSGLGG